MNSRKPRLTEQAFLPSRASSGAAWIGNTTAICRKCYVHPRIIEAFLAGELAAMGEPRLRKALRPAEVILMRFLEQLSAA